VTSADIDGMRRVRVTGGDDWRAQARHLLATRVAPERVWWRDAADAQSALFEETSPTAATPADVPSSTIRVPRRFAELADVVACHRDPAKWDILYRLLWRVVHENRRLLDVGTDQDVRRALDMSAQVRRDEHKMRAFVRFVRVDDPDGERYVAWHRPDHLIVRLAAPFFVDRFGSMRWSILTPDSCAHWDGGALAFTPGVTMVARPADRLEDLWRTYYAAMFNPARVNVRAMKRELPVRHWSTLPETSMIPQLVTDAASRTFDMVQSTSGEASARSFVPDTTDLESLRSAAPACRGCELHCPATQVVFGEGPADARIVLVGEQPGDREDVEGRPFVGPAGALLDRALLAAGLSRERLYLTNAVKHFTFEPRGKRRIHQTPRLSDVRACRPWLEAELQAIRPSVVVCLGGTAARSLFGPQARVLQMRGRVLRNSAWAPAVVVTLHPSAVLRAADDGERQFELLVGDLRLAASA
jgi:DNA polymerase